MRIAIIKDGVVENIIEGELDKVSKLFEEVAPETDNTNEARIGARWNGSKFEPVKLFESWTWNESNFSYEPPKPQPEGDYFWDEEAGEWYPTPEPVEEDLLLDEPVEESTE